MTGQATLGTHVLRGCLAILAVLVVLWSAGGSASSGFREHAIPLPGSMSDVISVNGDGSCEVLECPRCNKLCTAFCDVEYKECRDAGKRNCPRAYRSCKNGCTASLCRQCMPNQSGTTRLCYVTKKS